MATLNDVRKSFVKYVPYCGALGYSMLALNSMNIDAPFVGEFGRVLVFHGTLCFSHFGFGVYIYNRPILDVMKPPRSKRILWSIFGSLMMNFGSLLFWAMAKDLGPTNKLARAVVGLSSAAGLLYLATDYLTAVDQLKKGFIAERVETGEDGEE